MLSAERSLDPSSSSSPNQNEIKYDERNSALERIDSAKLDKIDLVASPPTPNFSIRDYVYESRSKRIGACWPFKPKFLQLCLKNGVKELLPPYELPHLIKNQPIPATPQPDPSVNDVLCQGRKLNHHKSIHSITENLGSVVVKDKKKRKKGIKKVKGPSELPEKKCKLVVKLSSSVPGTTRSEELVSNNSALIDQMASKICPVCKTFSSTSNTTLNAHIDQCLSMGSSTKRFELDVCKNKIKPRKKKLMVEIYATALRYTLEDLDRRNGTNWALSAVSADPIEALAEPTNPKPKEPENPRPVMVESRGKEREGAVYVDSNGIKIRILSKFNNVPALPSVVLREENKKGKVKFGKRKGLELKNMKKKKMKLERKKFKQFKLLKTKVQQPPTDEDGSGTGNGRTDRHPDPLLEISKDPVSPLGNWVCAKRSDIHKKRKSKNPCKLITQSFASITDHSPSTSSQIPKYSISKFSNSTLRLKLPRPLVGNGANSQEANAEYVSTNTGYCNSSSAEPQNCPPLSRKFQKQRSILKSGKKRREMPPSSSRVFHESTEFRVGETIREKKRFKVTQNELQEEFAPELEEIRENTEVRDGISPDEDTQMEIEDVALKNQLTEYVDTPNDEPINLGDNSRLQEEPSVARETIDHDVDNNDALDDHEDENVNEGRDDDEDDDGDGDGDGYGDDDDDDDDLMETPDETSLGTPQDDSSITSNGEEEMNLERSFANFGDLSESPSTASTMSRSTLNEPVLKQPGLLIQPLEPGLPVQVAERPKGVKEITDKPCVCSCRENLPKESNKTVTVTKDKQLPPLYIGPRDAGPFSAYRSFSRPDLMVSAGLESPSQSFSTLSQSPVPPSPNPVLRLMGKNLLVVNHEEISVQPPTPISHAPSGFGALNSGSNQNFSYQNFSSVVGRSQPVGNLYRPFDVSDIQRPVCPSPYVPNDMIVIDDPPKIDNMSLPVQVPMQFPGVNMVGPATPAPQNISILGASVMQPRPFFCFPAQNQAGPTGPLLYPRVGTSYITQQLGPTGSHEPGPFVPGSYAFRSPANHVGNPLYYSHTMR